MKKLFLSAATLIASSLCAAETVHVHVTSLEAPPLPVYHNRMAVFVPLHQVYERLKPNALYAGLEAWGLNSMSSKGDHAYYSAIGEIEFRMGYNFLYHGRDHLTPFAGIGVFKDWKNYVTSDGWSGYHYEYHYMLPVLGYGTVGFLYEHEFSRLLAVGTNLKGIIGGSLSSPEVTWGDAVVGFDFALPITFRFGKARHWDFRFEPFDIYLHGSDQARNYFGLRSTFGYRF